MDGQCTPPPYSAQPGPQQQGYPPPGAAGYQPPPPQVQSQQHSVVVVQQPGVVRAPGACPYCGVGFAREDYTILGILIALLFFPIGIICCMMMTERRCTSCKARL